MNETELTEILDTRGWLADAQGAGCYSLQLETPLNSTQDVKASWLNHVDVGPGLRVYQRLADCERLLYVGRAHSSIYQRLCDHANTEVRQARICQIYPPYDVHGVWPDVREFNLAADLAGQQTRCWYDGELL